MAKFSSISLSRLNTCHPDLIRLFTEVIKNYDCSILCGNRDKEEQDKAFHDGKSKVQFPKSKHNSTPSKGIDVIPCPIDWKDRERLINFIGYVQGVADTLGIKIRCGIDFNMNRNFKDDGFFDGYHLEIFDE